MSHQTTSDQNVVNIKVVELDELYNIAAYISLIGPSLQELHRSRHNTLPKILPGSFPCRHIHDEHERPRRTRRAEKKTRWELSIWTSRSRATRLRTFCWRPPPPILAELFKV